MRTRKNGSETKTISIGGPVARRSDKTSTISNIYSSY